MTMRRVGSGIVFDPAAVRHQSAYDMIYMRIKKRLKGRKKHIFPTYPTIYLRRIHANHLGAAGKRIPRCKFNVVVHGNYS